MSTIKADPHSGGDHIDVELVDVIAVVYKRAADGKDVIRLHLTIAEARSLHAQVVDALWSTGRGGSSGG